MFGRKKRVGDDARTMVIGVNSGSGANQGLTLGDVRDFVYRSMTLGVPLSAPVSISPSRDAKRMRGISVSTTDIPKPPDASMLWPPTPAHGVPIQTAPIQTAQTQAAQTQAQTQAVLHPSQNGSHNFHDGGTPEQHAQ